MSITHTKSITLCTSLFLMALVAQATSQELQKSTQSGTVMNYFAILKQASRQSYNYLMNFVDALPLTKMLLTSGAFLGLFFMLIRLVIVLGPIIFLGALTRESSEVSDYLKLLIEFYNHIVLAIDDQINTRPTSK